VLERVNGELADLLTGQSGGERILQDLEDVGAFVVCLDAPRSWFRYHRLSADLAGATRTRPIDWDLIARNYHQMISTPTTLRLRTAETDQVLRRLMKGDPRDVPRHRPLVPRRRRPYRRAGRGRVRGLRAAHRRRRARPAIARPAGRGGDLMARTREPATVQPKS
jgi:Tn3 transposase DDE domain